MKKLLISSFLAAFITAQASAVLLVQTSPNVDGLAGANVTFNGFADGPVSNLQVLPGVKLSYSNAVIVQNFNDGNGANPFPVPNPASDYLSIMTGGVASFVFDSASNKSFGFQWGSIDAYNTISFLIGNVLQSSFTGSMITAPNAANGNQGVNGSAYVTFSGAFNTVVLESSRNSFEIDNVSIRNVPDASVTLALFGAALLSLTFFRRFAV